jgi:hypothetical protein
VAASGSARVRSALFPLSLLLACNTSLPLARPRGEGLFVSTGINRVQAESKARQFCDERGEPVMRPVDQREVTVHVTGDPRIKQLELLFRCERVDASEDRP